MPSLLINCDLGEWESPSFTAELMPYLHLANIACGGHAGSVESIQRCAALAEEHGVLPGAHPGVAGNLGRSLPAAFTLDDFTSLLEQQISLYHSTGTPLHHIKLHGALYHLSEQDSSIRDAFLSFSADQDCAIVALAGGQVASDAKARGLVCLEEAFLDRNYLPNGNLVPRSEPNAHLGDLTEINARILDYHHRKAPVQPDTLCIHSDSPNSQTLAETARQTLDQLSF
ncbi:LamB/YcsF family protein [Verrucomicrobiaceae bacterium 5K15]|uniref:LamB/YcsF family protein n=1 Tax=Oceaniferula flava TaxID=2800421 RepID=A0AAE2VDW0_9BACT|nr:LamB/YcsF family protein [Oceaniferula flavus]MBK1855074.1 LamB/YcsF family protein [Oceaniferula flavus]MBM1136380.1 LamB/YcsF family protein [Oceaniferula flavus]